MPNDPWRRCGREILPGVFAVPQNGGKGVGYSHSLHGGLVYRSGGGWRPGNLRRKKMLKSSEGQRDLAFDHVVPCTAYAATECFVPVPSVDAAVNADDRRPESPGFARAG
jgi:hypothetical protein